MQRTTLITVDSTFVGLVSTSTRGKDVSSFSALTINFLAVLLKKK